MSLIFTAGPSSFTVNGPSCLAVIIVDDLNSFLRELGGALDPFSNCRNFLINRSSTEGSINPSRKHVLASLLVLALVGMMNELGNSVCQNDVVETENHET